MTTSLISKPKNSTEIMTGERCYIQEQVNSADVPQFSITKCRVEPGVTTQLHSLSVAEWYVISSGKGIMELRGEPGFAVGAGDTVAISLGDAQRITNTESCDLIFQCVCMPRFYPECYKSLEGDEEEKP